MAGTSKLPLLRFSNTAKHKFANEENLNSLKLSPIFFKSSFVEAGMAISQTRDLNPAATEKIRLDFSNNDKVHFRDTVDDAS